MVNHEVQLQDSPSPGCSSIVSFLSAPRHTTHITYFLRASPFERVRGWTIFNQTSRQWLGLWRPILLLSGTDKPAEYDIEPDRGGTAAIYSPPNPNIFRRRAVRRLTKTLWATMPWQRHKLPPVWGGEFYVENIQSLVFPWWGKSFSQVSSNTGGRREGTLFP